MQLTPCAMILGTVALQWSSATVHAYLGVPGDGYICVHSQANYLTKISFWRACADLVCGFGRRQQQ